MVWCKLKEVWRKNGRSKESQENKAADSCIPHIWVTYTKQNKNTSIQYFNNTSFKTFWNYQNAFIKLNICWKYIWFTTSIFIIIICCPSRKYMLAVLLDSGLALPAYSHKIKQLLGSGKVLSWQWENFCSTWFS